MIIFDQHSACLSLIMGNPGPMCDAMQIRRWAPSQLRHISREISAIFVSIIALLRTPEQMPTNPLYCAYCAMMQTTPRPEMLHVSLTWANLPGSLLIDPSLETLPASLETMLPALTTTTATTTTPTRAALTRAPFNTRESGRETMHAVPAFLINRVRKITAVLESGLGP